MNNTRFISMLREKRDEIQRIAARHGVFNIRIFGSVARGEENAGSDIDLLVDMERGRTLMDRASLILELQEFLGAKVDVISAKGLKERIRSHVLSEATPL